jgi:hypothetical protein
MAVRVRAVGLLVGLVLPTGPELEGQTVNPQTVVFQTPVRPDRPAHFRISLLYAA